jgi:hypothetical protein
LTAYFIFEFKSNANPEKIQRDLLEIWSRPGYGWDIDIFRHARHGTLICNVLYCFLDDPYCRERIEKILSYLFDTTIDRRVYYYRFNEAMGMYGKQKRRITLDQLLGEYQPTMGGYCIRYEVKYFQAKAQHNNLDALD